VSDRDDAPAEEEAYHALCAYSLSHGHAEFLNQHVVDAHTAQRADSSTRPMALAFALLGLYLHVERGWTGRQVLRAHIALARRKRGWPRLVVPRERGRVTAADVVRVPEGRERDDAVHAWCRAVWEAFDENRGAIVEFLGNRGIL
jgi:hypothetical protein